MDVDPNDPIEMMTTGAYYLRNGKQWIMRASKDQRINIILLKFS